jgi:hypothetical protein
VKTTRLTGGFYLPREPARRKNAPLWLFKTACAGKKPLKIDKSAILLALSSFNPVKLYLIRKFWTLLSTFRQRLRAKTISTSEPISAEDLGNPRKKGQ